jgi:radical SAM protein with 4Fe4S-binding SPASM domain
VRGRASDLSQEGLLAALAQAGVDHITVLYASADPAVHDALVGEGDHALAGPLLAAIMVNEIAPVAEIPLVEQTVPVLPETLAALREIGEHNYSFFAIAAQDEMEEAARAGALRASAMPQTADMVEELANQMDVRFIWQPPLERDPARSLAEQVQQGPRCSGDVAVRVEPDGEVIPARGPYRSAGNILTYEWPRIWNDQAFRQYRERVESPTRCDDCPGLAICAADCPRKQAGWAQ